MDAPKPFVSVIMSVFNGEQWLETAIRSIVDQTYGHWEFIIIDDASNEATQQILRLFRNDSRFRIVRQEINRGLTKNLNTAIGMCRGEYIARMDADDISLPNRLQKQVDYLQRHPEADLVAGFIEFIDESGKPAGLWPDDRQCVTHQQIISRLPWRNCLAHPTVMFRKKLMMEFTYNEAQTHSQDWDLWWQLADHRKQFAKIPETLLLYRLHRQSTTAKSNKGFALKKMHQAYQAYLHVLPPGRKCSPFNRKVRLAFWFNAVKLILSRIKRVFTS